jgi:hypothetical protein
VLRPDRTVAIICGASEWPELPVFEGAKAFADTAEAIRAYLRGPDGLDLPARHVLWLFDEPRDVAQGTQVRSQYDRMRTFLSTRMAGIGAARGAGAVILFVYIGHGSLFGPSQEYLLMLRDSREPEVDSSLRVASLAWLLRDQWPDSQRILVLDCCFAGLAARHFFQAGRLDQVIGAKTQQVLDDHRADPGVALLCAAGSANPARLASSGGHTLFGGELVRVLTHGDRRAGRALSLRQISDLVWDGLQASGEQDPPRPEVHVPNQHAGDLGSVGLFPNRARLRSATTALVRRRERVGKEVEAIIAEEGALLRYHEAVEKRVAPTPDAPRHAVDLRMTLAGVRLGDDRGGAWLARHLDRLEADVERARRRLTAHRRELDRLLGLVRTEYPRRVEAARARATRHGVAGGAELTARLRAASNALAARPCLHAEAEQAVRAYEDAVRRQLEGDR